MYCYIIDVFTDLGPTRSIHLPTNLNLQEVNNQWR